MNWERLRLPFRFRLQNGCRPAWTGSLIVHPSADPFLLGGWCRALETNKNTQIITISSPEIRGGHSGFQEFTRKPAENLSAKFKEGQFQVLPLNKSDKSRRRNALQADVNGEQPVATICWLGQNRKAVQISHLTPQRPDWDSRRPQDFFHPDHVGVSAISLSAATLGRQRQAEHFSAAARMNRAGTDWCGSGDWTKRVWLPFPTLIPLDGKPLAMAVGQLEPQGQTYPGCNRGSEMWGKEDARHPHRRREKPEPKS